MFSIPYKLESLKETLNNYPTITFEDIPTEDDVKRAVKYKNDNGFQRPHSLTLKLGSHFIFTLSFQKEKFYLCHERSYKEGSSHYLVEGEFGSDYSKLVEKIKEYIQKELEFIHSEQARLKRIVSQ